MLDDERTLEEIADDIIHQSYNGKYIYNYSGLILSHYQIQRRYNHEVLTDNIDRWMGRHGLYSRVYNKYRRDLNNCENVANKPHRMPITRKHYDPGFTLIEREEGTITLEEYKRRTGETYDR